MLETMHWDRDWPTAQRTAEWCGEKVSEAVYAAIVKVTENDYCQVEERIDPETQVTMYEIELQITDIEPEEPRKQRAVIAAVFRQIADELTKPGGP